MDTASRAADKASNVIHCELENGDTSGLHRTLEEVHEYEAQHRGSNQEFNAKLSADLKDVLPQMSLTWAQDHQSDLASYSNDSGSITKQGIADYEMATAHDPNHDYVDRLMADSLRQNWNSYTDQGDGYVHGAFDWLTDNQHLNSDDIGAALAPMQTDEQARMAISQLSDKPQAGDSLFRKLSEDGNGKDITMDSLDTALANSDPRFMNTSERATAQFLANHYTDISQYSDAAPNMPALAAAGTGMGGFNGGETTAVFTPITPDAINQYAENTLHQSADQIVHDTDQDERAAGGPTRLFDYQSRPDNDTEPVTNDRTTPVRSDDSFATGSGLRRDLNPDDRYDVPYACDDAPSAVPQQMFADAQVRAGEGFYQAAQRMLGPDASAEEVLGLAHDFRDDYEHDNDNGDPAGLRVGYNFLSGYSQDDWNNLVTKYPSLNRRAQDQSAAEDQRQDSNADDLD